MQLVRTWVKYTCGKHNSSTSLCIASVLHRCILKLFLLICFVGSHTTQLLLCYLPHSFQVPERCLAPCSFPKGLEDMGPSGSCTAAFQCCSHVSVNSRGTYCSLISWIRCRNSSTALKYWNDAKIPGCLKLRSFKARPKQGLRYPKWTLDEIQAPEYKTVTTELQNAAVQLLPRS